MAARVVRPLLVNPQLAASRSFATTTPLQTKSHAPASRTINSRWLSLIKRRIGKCLSFGLPPQQVAIAGGVLQQIARDWRELVAGSEGFLTGETRQGLSGHNVIWGEMDVMVTPPQLNPRFEPIDSMGHVNNVAYVRYAETARINWTRNFAVYLDPAHKQEWMGLMGSKGIGLILRSIKVDYKFVSFPPRSPTRKLLVNSSSQPMLSPDKISVYHKLSHPPHSPSSVHDPSSLHFDVIILSEAKQRPAARCNEDVVVYDYRIGQKVSALPEFMLEQFRQTWKLQVEAKRVAAERIAGIEAKVRELETGSWDREDAVEDMGGQ